MDNKELLLEFGNRVFHGVSYDKKKVLQNGQTIRLQGLDNDHYLEIYFQSIRNSGNYVTISPYVAIKSKCTKAFEVQKFASNSAEGLIFSEQIGYLSPRKEHKTWDVGESNIENATTDVLSIINMHITPFFQKINTKESLYSVIIEKSLAINDYSTPSLKPLLYILANNHIEAATMALTEFFKSKNLATKGNALKLFQRLESEQSIDIHTREFQDANIIKMAYIMGVRIS
ncbi:MAG: hypothetical protein IPN71_18565 [Fibrobacteres bacterium]|nr:hypothetical protein [Fibrobacterota bacterium]